MLNWFKPRERARDLCQGLNATREKDQQDRRRMLTELFGKGGDSVWMQPPFYCDYGSNILLGERVFFNFNCIVLDVCLVRVGDYTLFGPAVQIYMATDPPAPNCVAARNLASPSKSDRMCGWGRSDHLPRRADWFQDRDRCRERGDQGRSQRGIRCWKSLPGDPGNCRGESISSWEGSAGRGPAFEKGRTTELMRGLQFVRSGRPASIRASARRILHWPSGPQIQPVECRQACSASPIQVAVGAIEVFPLADCLTNLITWLFHALILIERLVLPPFRRVIVFRLDIEVELN